ncbi:RusA family crossover junction endodeoxyribonuclease [Aneurinibacillus aneurinilyticus]|uniref:RusA family crossover junction endodeoxyribonuclease n=1 Tax=Aneurinibacillus aneurinilyticus TaxID=1391 RepID=UPI0023F06503|nr:RusA family crossover junction endodeoxyribonuclease [Aneurinibacillus aneurinilyticus]
MPEIYRFTVPSRPRPKGRPRFGRNGRAYTPADTLKYEKLIRETAESAGVTPLESNDIHFAVNVYFRNKTHGDVDNYVKIAQDALNKVAYNDDKQIKHIEGHLYYDVDERMEIVISA